MVAEGVGQVGVGAGAQAVYAHALVDIDGGGPEQFGKLAGGGAAHEVHFEVAFLGVDHAEGAHGIGLAGGVDGDHAEGVALDAHGGLEAGEGGVSVQRGEAAAKQGPCHADDDKRYRAEYRTSPEQPLQPTTHAVSPTSVMPRL